MTTHRTDFVGKTTHPATRSADWETISSFLLSLNEDKPEKDGCTLAPVAEALAPLGVDEDILCAISTEVEENGEDLKEKCPLGTLSSVNVRVNLSRQARHSLASASHEWRYFVIQQIASSESDNLEALEHPRCYIDLYIYRPA